MIFSNFYFIICCLVSVFYLGGLLFFFADHEPNNSCEMTYMFEYPQYVKISQEVDKKYPKYGLYAYGEGRITYRARNMDFDGIPVLFIPGNAGSHQQVRSLSSVALRKSLNSRTIFHFDYFTVKLNSEYSALYGPVLNDQLEYVRTSLFRVLELYKKNDNPPSQIILIGHSVGGVIARKIVSTLPSGSNIVPLVIALATPFKRPLIKFDRFLNSFYKLDSNINKETSVISISGGYSDFLIPTYLTEANQTPSALSLVTTNIAKSWVESHHVQIVWCKQTVLAINRALFDIVDPKTKQISPSKSYRDRVFQHHLIFNSGTKIHLKSNQTELYQLDHKCEWSESILKQYSLIHPKGLREPKWYMVGLTNTPGYEFLTILAVNMEITNWIFACNAAYFRGPSRYCVSGQHLSQFSEIVPSQMYKRRLIRLNLHEIRRNNTQFTHIVFRALPTSKPLSYHVDIHGPTERKLEVFLPRYSLRKQVIMPETPQKAVVYELEFKNLYNMLQFYLLYVEPIRCENTQHHGMISLMVPWGNQNVHQPITVRMSIAGIFSQMARYYSPLLITNVAVVVLQAFRIQLQSLGDTGKCPIFFATFKDYLGFHFVVTCVYFLSKYANSIPPLNNILPPADSFEFPHGANSVLDFIVITIFLHMISIILVLLLVSAYSVSLFALESTVHKLTLKLLARSVTFTMQFSDYFMSFLQKVPFVVVGVLIFLCISTCGGLALCVGMVFYFLKLTQMSQDYIEEVVWFLVKSFAKKLKESLRIRKTTNSTNEQTNNTHTNRAIENNENVANNSGENNSKTDNENKEQNDNKDQTEAISNKEENNINISDQIIDATEQINQPSTSRSSVNYIEPEVTSDNSGENISSSIKADFNPIFFHSTLFFIWVMIMVLNIPAVLTWAHNFTYSKVLSPDESFIPGLMLSLCALPLWHLELPRTNRKYFHELSTIILVLIVLSLTYATISVYRLNYILTLTFVLIIGQQLFAPKTLEIEAVNEDNDDKKEQKRHEKKYDDMMKKID